MTKAARYHLFVDESGLFTESSTDPSERSDAERARRRFPSQLAGVLVADGEHDREPLTTLVGAVARQVGLGSLDEVHGTELKRDPRYKELLRAVATRVTDARIQAVRIVNEEGVSYGDRRANYTHILAELAVRLLDRLSQTHGGEVVLTVWPAVVVTSDDPDVPFHEKSINPQEYSRRLQEAMSLLAVRMGRAADCANWRLELGGTLSARKDPRLQICDLLSHASHDDYSVCDADLRQVVAAAFDDYDYTLSIPAVPERIRLLREQGSFGLALQTLAEAAVLDPSDEHADRIADLLGDLHRCGGPARDVHLALLANWVEQLVDHARRLDAGRDAARWMLDAVATPLRATVGLDGIAWFEHHLHRSRLIAANHLGDLRGASAAARDMNGCTPLLATRWEHIDVLLRGMVVEAVHLTDTFQHEEAATRVGLVAGFYDQLAGLCHDALGDVFPESVKSHVLGEALGTELQVRIHALGPHPDEEELAALRELSDRSAAQFLRPEDRERQAQYRAHLESIAGDHRAARRHLAQAMQSDRDDFTALWERASAPGPQQRWWLLHLLRLVSHALLHGDAAERDAAADLVRRHKSKLATADIGPHYPRHSILRYAATACAAAGDVNRGLSLLGQMRELYPTDAPERQPLLTLLLAAACVEVAACLWAEHPNKARPLLLATERDGAGARVLIERILRATDGELPGFARTFGAWPERLKQVLGEKDAGTARSALLDLAAAVRY